MLELTHIVKVVLGRQALLTCPAQGVAEPSLRDPDPCPERVDGPNLRVEVTDVHAFCLVEQVQRRVWITFGIPDPRHRDMPAVGVLPTARVFAKFGAGPQVLHRGTKLIPFVEALAHAHVHVGRSSHDGRAMFGRDSEPPLISAHRFAMTTLRDPNVSQGDRATNRVGDVSGPLEARLGLGPGSVRLVEVTPRPVRERQEPCCRSAAQVIVVADEFECQLCTSHRAGDIAREMSLCGPVDGDPARQTAKLRLIHDDRLSRWAPWSALPPAVVSSHRSAFNRWASAPSS